MMRFLIVLFTMLFVSCTWFDGKDSKINIFDGKSLSGWQISNFGGEGEVSVQNGEIYFDYGNPLTGITFTGDLPLRDNYAIEFEAQKIDGTDFFVGLTFPVKEEFCSLILGGWGGVTCGLSSFDYEDAANNETSLNIKFDNKRWYKVKLVVSGETISAFLDDKKIIETKINGRKVHIRPEVYASKPLGICSFETQAKYRNINIWPISK